MGKLGLSLDILEFLSYNARMNPNSPFLREDAVKLLRRHGIGPTRQRIDIAQVLFSEHQHLSADQIQARIDAHHAYASKATVYNTLKLFVEKACCGKYWLIPARFFTIPISARIIISTMW